MIVLYIFQNRCYYDIINYNLTTLCCKYFALSFFYNFFYILFLLLLYSFCSVLFPIVIPKKLITNIVVYSMNKNVYCFDKLCSLCIKIQTFKIEILLDIDPNFWCNVSFPWNIDMLPLTIFTRLQKNQNLNKIWKIGKFLFFYWDNFNCAN